MDHQGPTCADCTHDWEEYLADVEEVDREMEALSEKGIIF